MLSGKFKRDCAGANITDAVYAQFMHDKFGDSLPGAPVQVSRQTTEEVASQPQVDIEPDNKVGDSGGDPAAHVE